MHPRSLLRLSVFFALSTFLIVVTTIHAQIWQAAGLPAQVTSLAVHPNGAVYAGIKAGGVFRNDGQGTEWNSVYGGQADISSIVINGRGFIFAGRWDNNELARSSDDGATWDVPRSFDSPVTALALDDEDILYVGAHSVEISTNNGGFWTGLPYFKYKPTIHSMGVNWAKEVFAIPTPSRDLVVRSTPHSNHWDFANMNVGCRALAITPPGEVFLGSDSGMYRLADHIENWQQINNGLTTRSVRCIVLARNGDMFIGTEGGGVFRSHTRGGPWTQMNEGLTEMAVNTLALDAAGRLYAGTTNGVFRSSAPVTSVFPDEEIRSGLELGPAYPNPFRSETSISFSLPIDASVVLRAYDTYGREVAVLADGVLEAGTHHRRWNAAGSPAGLYFIRLHVAGTVRTQRCMLLR